ncbi:hypothetical protein [Sediminibacter sp. Hel_I_10]|uniref:hypothetical protein n=1 Tax=Sediminibacter sp. Hel_I_10 TaxID=1392490 RepID=UPI0012DE29BD|nr:hypothetical protein [Sediminibacter sp. Hel_I_10]
MKKPILTQKRRQEFLFPEIAIWKLSVLRDFERSFLYDFLEKIVDWLSRKIEKKQ